jgi:hypothetical protein
MRRLPGITVVLISRARIRLVRRYASSRREAPACVGRGCPAEEDLAAYIDGAQSIGSRYLIAQHLSWCPRCYAVYSDTLDFLAESLPVEDQIAALEGEVGQLMDVLTNRFEEVAGVSFTDEFGHALDTDRNRASLSARKQST